VSTDPIQTDYIERTNAAIDFIVGNLDREITLESVAKVACFSPFHFHRIFRSVVGETLSQFTKRLRLERALYLMSHASNRSLTDISIECGFGSSSDFSRSFKGRYGVSPSNFDVRAFRDSKRKEFESIVSSYENGPTLTRLPAGENPDGFKAKIRDLPRRTVAYIRTLDPYRENVVYEASQRLVSWAENRGLADGQWLGYMWEDPEIVALENCRYDVAVVVDENETAIRSEGEIGVLNFEPMTVADVSICGDIQLEQRAIDWLYGTWLPTSGYIPAEHPAFEAWVGRPFVHGFEKFELSCQLPLRYA